MKKITVFLLVLMLMFVLIPAASADESSASAITHIVTFNTNGGTLIPSKTVNNGALVAQPFSPVKAGHTFVEWRLNGVAYDFNNPVTSDLTLVAFYSVTPISTPTYTVTFNSEGGTATSTKAVIKSGAFVTRPSNPLKNGYTFVEWQLNGAAYNFYTPVTSNLTLVAVYKANTTTYTVTFDSNGGVPVPSPQIVKSGGFVAPVASVKPGYNFVGWQYPNGSAYNYSTRVMSDLTLVAVYKVATDYTVSFNSYYGAVYSTVLPPVTVNNGAPVTRPADPVLPDFTFVEWRVNNMPYDFSTPVTSNLTLFAVFKPNTYTVTFNTNGGTSIQPQIVNNGAPIAKPANPVKNGYTFVEWRLNGAAYDFSTPVTYNLNLIAIYK